jgi:hypothetical protein
MSALRRSSDSNPSRIRALVAVAAFSVIAACGTGVAAFTGLLPASKGVASEVTALPLVDIQVRTSRGLRADPPSNSERSAFLVETAPFMYRRLASTRG